jgi:hypothetical protein
MALLGSPSPALRRRISIPLEVQLITVLQGVNTKIPTEHPAYLAQTSFLIILHSILAWQMDNLPSFAARVF